MAKGENIFKRKDGRWEARYIKGRSVQGKIIYGFVYGKTYKEAKEKQLKRRKQMNSLTQNNTETDGKSLAFYIDSWLLAKRSEVKESTYVKYLGEIENHIKPYFGKTAASNVDNELAELFKNHLLYEKGLSANTVHSVLVLLHSIVKYAARQSEIWFDVCEIKYPKAEKKEMRVLTDDEERALIDFLLKSIDRYKLGVLLMLLTGMRIGEVCALKWGNINLTDCTIKIDSTIQRIKNADYQKNDGEKNIAKTVLIVGKPKSETSARTIPMNESLAELIAEFNCVNENSFLLSGNEKPTEPRALQYQIKKYTKILRLEGVHAHTFRHSFATRAIEVGFEIKSLSEILGHSTTTITLDRYVHSSMNLKRLNMKKLDFIGEISAVSTAVKDDKVKKMR